MDKIALLALAVSLCTLTVTTNAKQITQQMITCGGQTISTNCKNQATAFTLGYQLKKYDNSGTSLNISNPTSRNISIDQIEVYNTQNQRCELDSWGPDGETIYAKDSFEVMTSECKPQGIRKTIFVIGNKRYVL
ncbi:MULTISPECIES: hypothetical protein [Acinetobacter]|uniref:hypothetical protein n=1 Tax=Acinetobacter TaxID=469 RepID=UPI00141B8E32|nr:MULTISPECIES: hypothetical protein [Acinetobacter]MCS4298906.1 hypothetical protein [Acinetobacter guillouiae]MCW2252356.1 hypothetical protein [Acinetobacter sp. BIGb0204]NII38057.1 hypothetical protein [Acinetobacter sp. BIGb0196]